MFGVLVIRDENGDFGYLKAFSSLLDGQHQMEGFVPPIFDFTAPNGYFRQEEAAISALNEPENRKTRSQALQRWLFSQYAIRSVGSKTRDLIDIFASEPAILTAEEYFSNAKPSTSAALPPAGAGECCAPKLLQYAIANRLTPLALAEFWIGAAPKNELRRDGYFYGACLGKCRPILQHMLQGVEISDPSDKERPTAPIDILYEDDWLLIAMKPSGLLTTPGKESPYSLEQTLRDQYPQTALKAVHRLDRDTSGIVVLAKSEEAYRRMQELFRTRQVFKRYEAIVECLSPDSIPEQGEINLPLLPNPFDRPRQMVDHQHGKRAVTQYKRCRQVAQNRVFIDLFPLTGRTHQLRVHCAHPDGLNAPIVGDPLYGTPSDRLYLHAAEIQFTHPFIDKIVQIKVSL